MAKRFLLGRILDFGCGSGALASFVPPGSYLGIDPDAECLSRARSLHPKHSFTSNLAVEYGKFNTVTMLAVLEHLSDPKQTLDRLSKFLDEKKEARIVLTTPHPNAECVHRFGAAIGLFSKHAAEEHENFFARDAMAALAPNDFILSRYTAFQFGMNQLVLYTRPPLQSGQRGNDHEVCNR